jgi:type IV fimbrial biogenesis protein FimT
MKIVQLGFNLIEVMVTLSVLGVLIALGAPAFSEWLQSQRIRAAAESILNGMQVARGEAIRRNLAVQMVLELLPNSTWTVCEATISPCDSTLLADPDPLIVASVIQSRAQEEGNTGNTKVATTPAGAIAVTFSPLGGVMDKNPVDDSSRFTQVDVSNPGGGECIAAGGPMRCLRIVVTGGGSIRMCDPTPTVVAPDPRACP